MKTEIKKIGFVRADSGQLMICDPCFINNHFKTEEADPYSNHTIFKHTKDQSLWQFSYNGILKSYHKKVNEFPGGYNDVIPKYKKTPQELMESEEFIDSGIDPEPHIKEGDFSFDGMCKMNSKKSYGQFVFEDSKHAGVTFILGYGDGTYPVYAEFKDNIIQKVWIEFSDDQNMEKIITKSTNRTVYVLEYYRGYMLVLPEIDADLQQIEVYDPENDTLFIVGLDDSKSRGHRQSIHLDDPIKAAKEYVDWNERNTDFILLDSVGSFIDNRGIVYPKLVNGLPDIENHMDIQDTYSEWRESLSDIDEKEVEKIIGMKIEDIPYPY